MAPSEPNRTAGSIIAEAILRGVGVHAGIHVIGLCGAQGSGKSTAAAEIEGILTEAGLTVATLALDDLVLPRADRRRLAENVHPLLATRGPPGTHDVPLGLSILADLKAGRSAMIPRLDKVADDRMPDAFSRLIPAGVDVVIFEGWCVGARAQAKAALADSINALERDRDPNGSWRAYVNCALAADYQSLFGQIDFLILLKAPSFEVVSRWRLEQERANIAQAAASAQGMDATAIDRFVQYYERITRHMLTEMPDRAGLVLELDHDRRISCVTERSPA